MLKASSFVLACERAVCVRSPYSLKSRGGSHIKDPNAVAVIRESSDDVETGQAVELYPLT